MTEPHAQGLVGQGAMKMSEEPALGGQGDSESDSQDSSLTVSDRCPAGKGKMPPAGIGAYKVTRW